MKKGQQKGNPSATAKTDLNSNSPPTGSAPQTTWLVQTEKHSVLKNGNYNTDTQNLYSKTLVKCHFIGANS